MTEPFLYNGDNRAPIGATNILIAPNITIIGKSAFERCTSLTTIIIPPSVSTIEEWAFLGCTSLLTIKIPPLVTAIGERVFTHCTSLSTIELPPSLTAIGEFAFYGCTSLSAITLPPTVTKIGEWAFYNCISLTAVTFQPSVPAITGNTFHDCASLTIKGLAFARCSSIRSMTLPPTTKVIACNLFHNCSNLSSIELQSCHPYIIIKRPSSVKNLTINGKIGTLYQVLHNTTSVSAISQKLHKLLEMNTIIKDLNLRRHDKIHVNWRQYAKMKNQQGRLLLFTALEQSINWSDGLSNILQGNGAAIENTDVITGLEAFMLAAVGSNSNMETVFRLLQDHPGAINPYVRIK